MAQIKRAASSGAPEAELMFGVTVGQLKELKKLGYAVFCFRHSSDLTTTLIRW